MLAGRGDSNLTIPDISHRLACQVLTDTVFRFSWEEAVELSGLRPVRPKPRNTNRRAKRLRSDGYKTSGDICDATGVTRGTLHRWDGTRLPKLPRIGGLIAVPADQFDALVQRIHALRVAGTKRSDAVARMTPSNVGDLQVS